jgi:hypothetical protein
MFTPPHGNNLRIDNKIHTTGQPIPFLNFFLPVPGYVHFFIQDVPNATACGRRFYILQTTIADSKKSVQGDDYIQSCRTMKVYSTDDDSGFY